MLKELSEDINSIKKIKSEMKITITEKKNTLKEINSRLDEAEDPISDLKDKMEENIQSEQQKEKKNKK